MGGFQYLDQAKPSLLINGFDSDFIVHEATDAWVEQFGSRGTTFADFVDLAEFQAQCNIQALVREARESSKPVTVVTKSIYMKTNDGLMFRVKFGVTVANAIWASSRVHPVRLTALRFKCLPRRHPRRAYNSKSGLESICEEISLQDEDQMPCETKETS